MRRLIRYPSELSIVSIRLTYVDFSPFVQSLMDPKFNSYSPARLVDELRNANHMKGLIIDPFLDLPISWLIRIAKDFRGLALLAVLCAWPALAQNPLVCVPSAVQVAVAAEGLTEPLGDIVLSCTHGTPGAVVTGNLTIFLSVNITNKIAANNVTDAIVTVDTGAGPVVTPVVGELTAPNRVVFTGLTFTVPASGNVCV